eukprot:GFUD01023856.1.p1 GENE.GFUD01023856.1~~GFUD01023856.1.p1  ORF type:complete len:317 (+),score=55.55 GFUD01023856.1:371-1321(+)
MSEQDDLSTNLLKKDHENSQSTFNNYNKTKPVDVSSHVKRLFLDSKCSSATIFFRLHLSAHSYFHSPTPWNPGSASNLSTKVAKLLDSFRPGSSSYSPFQSKSDENNNESNQNNANHESENINGGLQLLRPSVLTQRVMEESNSAATIEDPIIVEERNDPEGNINQGSHQSLQNLENIQNSTISPEEQNRRRLYLNLGRPRPFYRVPSENDQNESGRKLTESKIHKKKGICSLKEVAKNQIVAMYGLKSLAKILNESDVLQDYQKPSKTFCLLFLVMILRKTAVTDLHSQLPTMCSASLTVRNIQQYLPPVKQTRL